MDTSEYSNLMRVEKDHWFYRGKREAVRWWIDRCLPLAATDLLVDCGAGTGFFANEMRSTCRVAAVDDYEESLKLARGAFPQLEIRRGSCTTLPVADGEARCVTALDVIEHIDDDVRAIDEFIRILQPGGLLVVTVPAFQSLWSDWDVTLHHKRRYGKEELLRKMTRPELEIIDHRFVNRAVFPLVWLVRHARKVFSPAKKSGRSETKRAEDQVPPEPLNTWLRRYFVFEATQNSMRFPFGVGQLVVARRR